MKIEKAKSFFGWKLEDGSWKMEVKNIKT